MVTDSNYLIVYGTLRPAFSNPFAHYLRQYSQYIGEGSFTGQLYDLGNYPGAVYGKYGPQMIQGTVYNISQNKSLLLDYLDDYEGISPHLQQPHEYRRTIIPIDLAGNVVDCWFYEYNWPADSKKIIECGNYERYVGI